MHGGFCVCVSCMRVFTPCVFNINIFQLVPLTMKNFLLGGQREGNTYDLHTNMHVVMMIAFITFNSSLVPLIEGLWTWSSNPWGHIYKHT
jgi:hypothetical protein